MSRKNGKSPKVDLNMNLSPQAGPSRRVLDNDNSPHRRSSSSSSSPSSCVSSLESEHGLRGTGSPEATSMVLAACPRCLMYVMLHEEDPKCPKCHSAVIIDFLRGDNITKKTRKSLK